MRALDGKTFDCHDYMSECTVEILLGKLINRIVHYYFLLNQKEDEKYNESNPMNF